MDFSSANTQLWGGLIQLGYICAMLLLANLMRRKIPFVYKSMMPTAVLAGFLLLILRTSGLIAVSADTLEMITYHGIGLGFIALSLRAAGDQPHRKAEPFTAAKSGALIVSCYTLQGILGLIISLGLSATFMPGLFAAAGILLPMGYGQGPGQANNVGGTYESLGFAGGRSFGLAIAAAGFLSACIVGVAYLAILQRKGKVQIGKPSEVSGSVTVDTFQDHDEIPISQSVDRLSVQVALVLIVYALTYFATAGLSQLAGLLGGGLRGTLSSLLWGFNFITGAVLAMLFKSLLRGLRKSHLMTRQYQNNYLLSRISGLAFDLMIIAGIASIEISDLAELWVPFILMSVSAAILTLLYLQWICKKIYPGYYYEGLLSMYGMMTGTISSGVLLLREIDPMFETPASGNLLTGSGMAVLFGAPMLLLIGIAPHSPAAAFGVLGLLTAYTALLLLFMLKIRKDKKK